MLRRTSSAGGGRSVRRLVSLSAALARRADRAARMLAAASLEPLSAFLPMFSMAVASSLRLLARSAASSAKFGLAAVRDVPQCPTAEQPQQQHNDNDGSTVSAMWLDDGSMAQRLASNLEQQAASLAQIVSTFRMHPEHGASHPAAPRAANVQAMGPRQALPAIQARVSPARAQPQVKEAEWAAF